MKNVYCGQLLEVDLATGKTKDIKVPEEDFLNYLGGSGLAAKILYKELDPSIDPLAPENPLIFMTGLLTGTMIPTASKSVVCARAPLTGIWNEATVGGEWGTHLKGTGYDGIILRNKSEKPVYLWISDNGVEIRDASTVWGKDSFETEEILKKETDPKAMVAAIGVSGEKLVRFASVMFQGKYARTSGRGGVGANMGSKNLKAIVLYGTQKPGLFDRNGLIEQIKKDNATIKEFTAGLTNLGTAGGLEAIEGWGDMPIKNWSGGTWTEGAAKTSGKLNIPKYSVSKHTCHACPIKCSKIIKIDTGDGREIYGHAPEYETVAAFGSNCLCDSYEVIAKANDRCNDYGLDTISAGAAVAFAMECYEKGIITKEDCDGLELTWGSEEAILTLLDLIAQRKGIGDMLAEGTRRAAEKLGTEALKCVVDVKGMELACHDPRAFTSMAINYATANRGGCHLETLSFMYERGMPFAELGYTDEERDPTGNEGKAKICRDFQDYQSIYNSVGLCKYLSVGRVGPQTISTWINLATGWSLSKEDLMKIGERTFNLKRMYNVKLGMTKRDDTLAERMLKEPTASGKHAGVVPDLEKMLEEYYQLRNWSYNGNPEPGKLQQLDLGWTI